MIVSIVLSILFLPGVVVDAKKREACEQTVSLLSSLKLLLESCFGWYFISSSQKRISQTLNLSRKLVSQICRQLQDICSRDLEERPFTPFGGPGAVGKCDESKFNHKAKVKHNFLDNFL